MSANSVNWSSFIFPSLFCGFAVVINDVFISGYSFNDPVVLVDIGLNICAYLLSDVIVQFGLNRMFVNDSGETLLESGTDIVLQPVVHGLMMGIARPMIHSGATLIDHPINFMNSFTSGAIYNIVAKYISSPIVFYFDSK